MKYYGIKSKSYYERISYSVRKSKISFCQKQPFSKRLRRKSQLDYSLYFNPKHFHIHNCSIPNSKYCTPFCLICSDLISIQNVESVKTGLKNLILHHLNNDYLTSSIDDEINKLDSLVRKIPPSYSSIKIGRYSFTPSEALHQKISYFTVYFKSASSKFISVEFHIFFSENFKKELSSFISKDYTSSRAFIHKSVSSFSKDVGAKESSNILYYPNEILKSDHLYEKFCFLKWDFFNFIQKYFKTFFHSFNTIPPSVVFYGTNICYNEPYSLNFWRSVGVDSHYGETFLQHGNPFDYGRLFFRTCLSDRYNSSDFSNFIYIVNTEKKELSFGFQTIEEQIDLEFSDITSDLFLLTFLSIINQSTLKELSIYRQRLAKIKLKRSSLKKLLFLRYQFEKTIAPFESFLSDYIRWNLIQTNLQQFFPKRTFSFYQAHYSLSALSVFQKDSILEQISSIKSEFSQEIDILQHLADYSNEAKSSRFSWFSTIASIITLYFLIFPENTKPVATFLSSFIKAITTFIQTFKSTV